jgi:ribosomal protein S12 methylthiotransferase
MGLQRQIVEARLAERVGERVRVMVDGPSPESDLVLTARLGGQAPDIDAVVYLDECDPSAFRPGDLVDAVITDARGYDVVARPGVI